jgi:hypothetical protein
LDRFDNVCVVVISSVIRSISHPCLSDLGDQRIEHVVEG